MLGMFSAIKHQMGIHKLVKQAALYTEHGDHIKALDILEKLTFQNPKNVYLRHETAILQKKLNKEIDLPDISSKSNENTTYTRKL